MSNSKQPSKRKRRSKTPPVLGTAGLSLSLASTASAVSGRPAVDLVNPGNGDGDQVALGEEEISDVSLATFYVLDKEGDGTSSMVQLVGHGCGGCHAHVGCGGSAMAAVAMAAEAAITAAVAAAASALGWVALGCGGAAAVAAAGAEATGAGATAIGTSAVIIIDTHSMG